MCGVKINQSINQSINQCNYKHIDRKKYNKNFVIKYKNQRTKKKFLISTHYKFFFSISSLIILYDFIFDLQRTLFIFRSKHHFVVNSI
jgi:hypothetical protein